MSGSCLLGLDVGGSRTRALVSGLDGRALGAAERGPGNHEVVGYAGLAAAMRDAAAAALGAAGLGPGEVAAAGFGVAGFDWESERADTMAAIAALGLGCPIELRNDAALGLFAGSSELWGVNLSAGTSNNCYGRSREGREGSLAGGGAALGEFGGAAEIAQAALVAVHRARIRRGPPTALAGILCRLTSSRDADELVERAALGRLAARPAWAPEVFAAARAGDEAAAGILRWAGRELGESAAAVARQVGIEGECFELVLSGSLFGLEPSLEEGVAAVMAREAPGARPVRLAAAPSIGALALAALAAGLDPAPIRARLLAGGIAA